MLSIFQDLLIRMLVIVGICNLAIWWKVTKRFDNKVWFLFVVEMIAITLSLWYDIVVRYKV
jgi:hypothetical protein